MSFDKYFFKEYFLKPLCYATVILIVLFLLNKFTYFNISIGSNSNFNSFEVIGSGKVTAIPNIAQTTYAIEEKGATQDTAKNSANSIQDKAMTELEKLGIKKEDIKTLNFSVNPNYEVEAQPAIYPPLPQKQNGYVANITVQIQSDKVDLINKAVDALTALGANVSGVNFTYADKETYVEQAQNKAVADAKAQAKNLAKAAGFKLGKIVSIRNVDDQSGYPQPYGADSTSLKAAPNLSTELQPGSNEIAARIGISYYIKN